MKVRTQRAIIAYVGGMFFILTFTGAFIAYNGNPIGMIFSPLSLLLAVACFWFANRR
ncbi:hypothetical protein JXB41_07135 [Candidatus Woesearchaeota archaeon]|nr:hypothetical protein [Candidatus Woesearchaeota archaeon]